MTLSELFQALLNEKYIQLEEETASYNCHMHSGTLYIFFEWSNGKTDWYNNLDFPAKPYRNMENRWYAHRGFLRVWKVIEDHLRPYIMDPSVKKIVIGGYSHGAAIALLCHEFCMFNRRDLENRIFGYGFGCPRVLHGHLTRQVKKRFRHFFVIRNGRDIVTHVPPALFGFRHVGEMIVIGRDSRLCPVDAHRPENYTAALMSSPAGKMRVDCPYQKSDNGAHCNDNTCRM